MVHKGARVCFRVCRFTFARGREKEIEREGRRREQTWVKVLSAIFLIFFPCFCFLIARRCSPVGDVIGKCAERRRWLFFFAWIKGFFPPASSSSFSVILRYFCWKKRGGWNKRRRWCRFGVSNQTKEQRILPKLTSRRRLLPGRRRSWGRGKGRSLWMKMRVYAVA